MHCWLTSERLTPGYALAGGNRSIGDWRDMQVLTNSEVKQTAAMTVSAPYLPRA